jgi:hypothetical protein
VENKASRQQPFVTIAWVGFFLEFSPKIQKGVLYLVSIVTNIATVTIGGTLANIIKSCIKWTLSKH